MVLEKVDPVLMLMFFDKITGNLNSGANVDAIFLDFAKPFDKVLYHRLLKSITHHRH